MDDHWNPDELLIHWIEDIPVADLTPQLDAMLPAGDWLMLEDVDDLLDATARRLCSLRGKTMSGPLVALVNRSSLSQMAAAELPTNQRPLVLTQVQEKQSGGASGDVSIDGRSSAVIGDAPVALAGAIHAAESLLRGVASGTHVSAEQFIAAVNASPDPDVTRNALKLAGSGNTIYGDAVSYSPGEFRKFPETLESSEKFRMRFSKFGAVGLHEVVATFEWLHVPGQVANPGIGELLKAKQRVPVYFASSVDALVFRIGAAAGLILDADVSITVSAFALTVERFTLSGLVDREESLKQLDRVVIQLRLPLDDLLKNKDEPDGGAKVADPGLQSAEGTHHIGDDDMAHSPQKA